MSKFIFIVSLLFSQVCFGQLSAEKYIALARGDLESERYSSAIQRLNFALKTQPYNIEAYFLRAMSKYNLSDFQGAVEDYTQCIRLNPTTPAPFQNRGLSRSRMGDDYGAIEDFDRAIKIESGSYFLYINKAYSQLQLELYEEAIKSCSQGISLNPYLESGYMMRGLGYTQNQEFDKAIEDFTKVIEIKPNEAEAYLRRAIAKNEQLDVKGALEDCDKGIALDSMASMGYFVRANLHVDRLNYEAAIEDYNHVIDLNPNNSLAYYNRGNAKTKLDDYRGAAYDFSRVTELNPENILGHFNLALTYHKLERYDLALQEYSTVLYLYPEMEDAWFNRAFVKKHLGDEWGAKQDYDKGNALRGKNREKEFNMEEAKELERLTDLDADFYQPDFKEEEVKITLFSFPLFEISETSYQSVSKPQLQYNFSYLTEFNEKNQNQPYFFVNNWLLPETTDSVPDMEPIMKMKTLDRTDEEIQRTLLWQAVSYKKQFDFNNSLATYDTLINTYPMFALAYFNKANTLFNLLELLLKLESSEGAFIDLGADITPIQLKDVQTLNVQLSAIERLYRQTLDFESDFYLAWFNLALVKAEKGEFEEAIEAYSKVIKINDQFAEAYFNRGVTYLYLKNNKKACNDFSKAGELGIQEAYKMVKKYCH